MTVDGERVEKNLIQMHRDLAHGKFTLEELRFFKFGFNKLEEATANVIKRADEYHLDDKEG